MEDWEHSEMLFLTLPLVDPKECSLPIWCANLGGLPPQFLSFDLGLSDLDLRQGHSNRDQKNEWSVFVE